jgi:aspartyl-tRNA(Asn)/glutamyl-tRNA(Gln) amidotransferase subunit A
MTSSAHTRGSDELIWLGIADGARLIRQGDLSPVEWTQALIARLEGAGAILDAFIHANAALALDQARQAQDKLASAGDVGPLHGVPCAIKDIFETADMPTTAHSSLLRHHQPGRDAYAVARLREAGAVILGKTATHEFAHGGPAVDLPWPPARNPWNLDHFPGGSSSGSAVALAGGLAPAALGTDTGGSIRIPSGLCGVTGLKPTYGRVSRSGVFALSPALDTAGPMARSAVDCALLLQAIAGHDPRDPASARVAVPNYSHALDGDLRGVRIGVVRHFWEHDTRVHPDSAAAVEEALSVLQARGAQIHDVTLAPLMDYSDVRVLIQEAEAFAIYHAALRESLSEFGSDFLGRVLPGCLVPAFAQSQAWRRRRLLTSQMRNLLAGVDILLTPGPGPAPRFDARETHGFLYGLWSDRPNLLAPFSVTGFPTLCLGNGFSGAGLPTSMQIVGRPWDEALVLKVGEAFQRDTDWHQRRPSIPHSASPVTLAAAEPQEPLDEQTEAWVDACLAHAQLRLSDQQRMHVSAAAPRVLRMIQRLGVIEDRSVEPGALFSLVD